MLINGVCWAKYNVDEPGRFANPANPNGMFINGTGERDGLPRAVFPVGIAVLIWAICERLPKIPVLSAGGYLPSKK